MNEQESIFQEFETEINTKAKEALLSASKWSKILSILYFIIIGLLLIVLIATSSLSIFGRSFVYSSILAIARDSFALILILGIIAGILAMLVVLQLLRFSFRVRKGIEHESDELLEIGFANLKVYFIISGIATILAVFLGLLKLIL